MDSSHGQSFIFIKLIFSNLISNHFYFFFSPSLCRRLFSAQNDVYAEFDSTFTAGLLHQYPATVCVKELRQRWVLESESVTIIRYDHVLLDARCV